MTGVAVKVTGRPEQTGFTEAEIVTLTGRVGITVMVIMFDVSGLLVMQVVSEEVRMQETRSPDAGG